MKKTLLMAALVLISAGCYAQKANVKRVKGMLNSETPDYAAARQLIEEAKLNEETKGQAETWFVSGQLGFAKNDAMNMDQALQRPVDDNEKGLNIEQTVEDYLMADQIAMTPTLDKKGREVVDQKTRNNVARRLLEIYEKQDLVKYGIYLNEQHDFEGAYKAFKMHLDMHELPMMQDPKMQAKMPKDSIYDQYMYFTGIFAIQAEKHAEAIAALNAIKDGTYQTIPTNILLYQEYQAAGDTLASLEFLHSAIARFPQETDFMGLLVNYYIQKGDEPEAIRYLQQAIETNPNLVEYRLLLGRLHEDQKNFDEALACFDAVLAMDPNSAAAEAGKGYVFVDKGAKVQDEATYIKDNKAYKQAMDEANALYAQAVPFFERAHQLDAENTEYKSALSKLYYRLKMDAKYEALQAE